jgi:nucleotide-binding universal stress UspA family protein
MFNDLIVGFDGSAGARDALAFARLLALDTAARPAVIYVRPGAETTGDDVSHVLDEARRLLADAPGASVRCVPGRSVTHALSFAAEEAEAALIVLGATRRCGLGRVVPGAIAEAVIQAAPCPVAVAPTGYAQCADRRRPFGLIAAAVDAGADTERIARVASGVAARAGATLRLVTVADVVGVPAPMAAGTIGYVTQANVGRDCATDALDRAARAAGADVAVERRVAGGRVSGAVAKLSEDADLLVIGSRGYGPLRRVAAGTHTGQILHAACCPVLVLAHRTGEQFDERLVPLAAGGARPGVA